MELATLLNRRDEVATANKVSLVDSAILRWLGRLGRVVRFDNPDAVPRLAYFYKLPVELGSECLDGLVKATAGFSFALLQEGFIPAAQQARSLSCKITMAGLEASAA